MSCKSCYFERKFSLCKCIFLFQDVPKHTANLLGKNLPMLGFNVVLPEDVFGPAGECLGCMIGSPGVYNCERPGVCGRARVYN